MPSILFSGLSSPSHIRIGKIGARFDRKVNVKKCKILPLWANFLEASTSIPVT